MYNQSTNNIQNDYFISIKSDPNQTKPFNRLVNIKRDNSDALLYFKQAVTLTESKGIALLILTLTPEQPSTYQYYILQNSVRIHPGVYFNTLALTPDCKLYLEPTNNESPNIVNVDERMKVQHLPRKIQVQDIYGLHYQVYASGEAFTQQNQSYFELILVDQGEASLELGYNRWVNLAKNDAWLNYPGKTNQVQFKQDGMTTLVSVLFSAEGLEAYPHDEVIHLSHRHLQLIERMVNLSHQKPSKGLFIMDEMIANLQLLILQMLTGDNSSADEVSTSMRENYENDLFQKIVDYLQEHVASQNQVNDLVKEFSVSRSTLQMLFKKYADTTPKAYINHLRLKRSKVLIHESKLSLSEIANELGYGSIQYFSRAFSKEFGLSPSSYAKSILK